MKQALLVLGVGLAIASPARAQDPVKVPIVEPSTQRFGKGFGHRGSTSNIGAWMPAPPSATAPGSGAA
jgi:hypothetical protein